jgi:ketosteroid isomerase-like protein
VKTSAKRWAGPLALVGCLVLASIGVAPAEDMSARALSDRAEIQDLITRYYYNFGKPTRDHFADFYAEDAEFILGEKHFNGRAGIIQAYEQVGANSPVSKAYSFNITISNPLVVVHGDTATAELVYTEYLMDKQGDTPHIRTQGREYSTFVKIKGVWRYKTREVKGGMEPPVGWKE